MVRTVSINDSSTVTTPYVYSILCYTNTLVVPSLGFVASLRIAAMDLDAEGELVKQLFSNSQSQSQAVLESQMWCERSASDSADNGFLQESGTPESHASSSPSQHCKTTSWWAPLIKQHVRESSTESLDQHEPLEARAVVSVCAGACSEAEVLAVAWTWTHHYHYETGGLEQGESI